MTVPPSSVIPGSAGSGAVHEQYVQRLRSRLAKPEIELTDARDGLVDCFVSSYFEGVKLGLAGIVGIDASPDDVATVTTELFRKRLENHGASFENPSIEALALVKEEVDRELHFSELPAELNAVHDQVCSLLLAKAEGTLDHEGDTPVVSSEPSRSEPTSSAYTQADRPASSVPTRADGVDAHLRAALEKYLLEVAQAVRHESTASLAAKLERANVLLATIAQFQ